jgi:hypothetical protein
MVVKTKDVTCTITTTWNWEVTGYTPTYPTVVRQSVTLYQEWRYYEMYAEWVTIGSMWESPSGGSDLIVSSYPPTPTYFASDGETTITSGSGTSNFSTTGGGDPIYGWVSVGTTLHNHTPTYAYDDGTYAGTLNLVSCNGTKAPTPNYSGSYQGQQDSTSGTATASYSGEVALKPDTTKPTIAISSHSGVNAITINWTASDDRELRATNTFAVEISGPDNTTLVHKGYLPIDARTHTFQNDGTGAALKVGSVYLTRVIVVDASNNTAYVDRYVTYEKTKPTNFAWTYSKSSESDVNLYASEWNNLLAKINEFREYKGLTRIETFTIAVVDDDIRAIMFNQAVNIINTLSPSVSPPSAVSSEDEIYASQLDGLVTSLNSVA